MLTIVDKLLYFNGRVIGKITSTDRALIDQFQRRFDTTGHRIYPESNAFAKACRLDGIDYTKIDLFADDKLA